MNNKKIFISFILVSAAIFLLSCGDDSGILPVLLGPDIAIKSNSVYYFTNDTISQSGMSYRTTVITKDSVGASLTFVGKSAFQIYSTSYDTSFSPPYPVISRDTTYISYTSTEGKYYQYGVKRFFDSTQAADWQVIADFTVPLGTDKQVFTIDRLFGQSTLTAKVFSKVVVDTVINTTGNPSVIVNCYRVALRADVYAGGTILIGSAYIDYYIGYNSTATNPSGTVRIKFYPVNFPPPANFRAPGVDQKLQRFLIP